MSEKIVVFSTCGSADEAANIARRLVEARLAACVTVIPGARSFYRWKGALEEAGEWLLMIKSRSDLFERLRNELTTLHSYEVPELLAVRVVHGSAEYLAWLDSELAEEAG
jgi:periplasmic divalent cation tolerance protein